MNFDAVARSIDNVVLKYFGGSNGRDNLSNSSKKAARRKASIFDFNQPPPSAILEYINGFLSTNEAMESVGAILIALISLLILFTIWGAFAWLFYNNYISTMTTPFISLDSNAGQCSNVYRPFSGKYFLTTDGVWSGSKDYKQYKSVYEFDFNNAGEDFSPFVKDLSVELSQLSVLAHSLPIQRSILYWMYYEFIWSSSEYQQKFSFVSDPYAVFNPEGFQGFVSVYDCSVTYNAAEAITTLKVDFNGTDFNELGPLSVYAFDSDDSIVLDHVSVSAAVAVNLGIMPFESLIPVATAWQFNYHDEEYFIQPMVNPRYYTMDPIACITASTTSATAAALHHKCLHMHTFGLGQSFSFSVPIMDHVGFDWNTQTFSQCSCNPVSVNVHCSALKFITSIFFGGSIELGYEGGVVWNSLFFALDTLLAFESQEDLFTAAYNYLILNETNPGLLNPSYAFAVTYGQQNTLSSTSKLVIPVMDCTDSFYFPDSIAQASTPPVNLFEHYFDCLPSSAQALYDSFALASSVLQMLLPVITLFILTCSYLLLRAAKVVEPFSGNTQDDKQRALDELAKALLQTAKIANSHTASATASTTAVATVQANYDASSTNGASQASKPSPETQLFLASLIREIMQVNSCPSDVLAPSSSSASSSSFSPPSASTAAVSHLRAYPHPSASASVSPEPATEVEMRKCESAEVSHL